jgi:hypothetical protein
MAYTIIGKAAQYNSLHPEILHGIRATPWVLGRSPPHYGPRVWLVRPT